MMPPRIAICHFGITRALDLTIRSIRSHVVSPVKNVTEPDVCAHFFAQHQVVNARSEENGVIDPDAHQMLGPDWLQIDAPDTFMQDPFVARLKSFGDYWEDDFRSLRNLLHQLRSLETVTQAALDRGAEICIFARPDLTYHDPLTEPLAHALKAPGNLVQLPYWQPFDGLNDRFAICKGRDAIAAYGQRLRRAEAYCQTAQAPLHAESLVAFALSDADIPVKTIAHRASRTRIGGHRPNESFDWPARYEYRRRYPLLARSYRAVKALITGRPGAPGQS